MNYSFDELVRKQCIYCLRFNPVDETCKVSGKKARNTIECNCFMPVRDHSADDGKKVDHDAVNHPAHYTQGGIECIDALKAATVGLIGIEAVCTANAIKYLWRWKHKNGVQDIDKAIWYLERLKKELSENDER